MNPLTPGHLLPPTWGARYALVDAEGYPYTLNSSFVPSQFEIGFAKPSVHRVYGSRRIVDISDGLGDPETPTLEGMVEGGTETERALLEDEIRGVVRLMRWIVNLETGRTAEVLPGRCAARFKPSERSSLLSSAEVLLVPRVLDELRGVL